MPGRRFIITGLLLVLSSPFAVADSQSLRSEADAAAKAGRWDKALASYLKLQETTPSLELRDRIRDSLRQAKQSQRLRDESFQQFVVSLRPAEALNLFAEVVEKLNQLHVDPRQASYQALFHAGLLELDRALADSEFRQRHLSQPSAKQLAQFRDRLQHYWAKRVIPSVKETRAAAFELLQHAQDELGVKNPSGLLGELLCGACASVDEYTLYVPPRIEQSAASPLLELANYGLNCRVLAGELVVESVTPGSWAALQTPLRKGDRILRFNGVTPNPLQPRELAQAALSPGMLGHELELQPEQHLMGTSLTLPTPLPTVYGVSVLNMRDGVGYVRIAAFKESTPREFDDALNSLKSRGARAVIVDVRGNSGGSFPAAVQTTQRLLPHGIIVTTQGQSPEFAHRVFSSDSGMTAHDLPAVLLVDGRTMSAAEVMAAAWKDHQRAYLIGMPTYGKGIVQGKIRLQSLDHADKGNRSGSVLLSLAKAFRPNGEAINGQGVVPHQLESDPNRQLDHAVNKALELLDP
jgi:carboxyl-terminal processing protease